MDGQLSDRPLAEIISEMMSARVSGALRLARERAKAAVYFEQGRVVAALSNLRTHRLAELARRSGLVAEEHLEGLAGAGLTDERLAAELVRSGALTGVALYGLLSAQSEEVLRVLLRWDDGTWEFDPRVRLATGNRARPEVDRLLFDWARELTDDRLASLIPDTESLSPPESAPDGETLTRLGLGPTEAFILSRVTEQTTLAGLLLVGGLPEAETRRAAYALALAGLLGRPNRAAAFTPEEIRKAAASVQADTAPSSPDRVPPSPESQPFATAAPAGSGLTEATKGGASSGFAADRDTATQAERPATGDSQEEVRAAMEELLEMGRKETHYEVLGVGRSAQPDEIKRAYYSVARRLHPDRFRRDAGGEFVRQLDVSFARVTQAYEVLKDSSQRAVYDMKLAKQADAAKQAKPAPRIVEREAARDSRRDESPSPQNAEEKFQQGLGAMQKGDYATARRLFGEAALIAPRQARYRAHYGRELARDRATRRQAESELQAAIALDERNPAYRVMLAELYLEVGLRRRAEGELRRALELAPDHDAATRLLKKLSARS
jgi:curved DNA-binding protein CbpA